MGPSRIGILLGEAALCAMLPGLAWAQTAPSDTTGLTEIIVTAQKREESLQDVPVTVSVVTGEQLARQNITNLTELQYAAPELNYNGAPASSYSIRGSGTTSFTRSVENNVLLVVDGVVQGQLTPPTTSLFDIARVEVLSGPQGMLFGKNASAGVINIVTNSSDPTRSEGLLRAEIGEDGYEVFQGVANLPLSSNAAVRLNAFSDSREGRFTNRFNDRRLGDVSRVGGRARFLWEPSDTLTLNLNLDYEKEFGGNTVWQPRSASGLLGLLLTACGVTPGPENTDVCLDGPSSQTIESYGGALQIDWRLGDHTLTSITANRQYARAVDTDTDTSPLNLLNRNYAEDFINQFSQELRVASPAGERLEYVAGLFYYDYQYAPDVDQAGTLGFLPFIAARASTGAVSQYSYAAFGQATYRFTDAWSAILGARFTHDVVRSTTRNFVNPASGVFSPLFSIPDSVSFARAEEDNVSWRAGLRWEPSANTTVFATYSRGYKGPAVNNLAPGLTGPAVIEPEIPTNIEVGVRTDFFDRRLSLDATVYDTVIEDYQAQTIDEVGGLNVYVFTNADEVRLRGVQASAIAVPVDGLTLTAAVNYADTEYGEFFVPCSLAAPAGCVTVGTGLFKNVEGDPLPGVPEWKVVAGVSYERPLFNGLEGTFSATANWRDDTSVSASGDPALVIDSYALVDARVSVGPENGRWRIAAFGKNVFDKRAPNLIFPDPLQPVGNYVQTFGPNSFRTLGVSLELRY